MVSYNLRPHVLVSWNSHQYRESIITGAEPNEVMVEDWLSLTNPEVQAHLGHVFADNRVETRYDALSALLCSPNPGDMM